LLTETGGFSLLDFVMMGELSVEQPTNNDSIRTATCL